MDVSRSWKFFELYTSTCVLSSMYGFLNYTILKSLFTKKKKKVSHRCCAPKDNVI